jgi:uncharacterized protein YndB with AHSA1/START domain
MRRFAASVDIEAPASRVWEVMTDVERWHEWTPSVTSIRRLDEGPLAVGSRVIIRQPGFPPARWTVTRIEPGLSFTWVSPGPGFRGVGRHSVEATATGSRASLLFELEGVLGGLFGRLTRGITERYVGHEAAGLKARSENPQYRHA